MQYKRCCALQFSGELTQALPAVQVGSRLAHAGDGIQATGLFSTPVNTMHGIPGTSFWPSTAWLALSQCNFILHSMQAALDCLHKRRTVLLARIAAPPEGDDAEKLRAGAPGRGAAGLGLPLGRHLRLCPALQPT